MVFRVTATRPADVKHLREHGCGGAGNCARRTAQSITKLYTDHGTAMRARGRWLSRGYKVIFRVRPDGLEESAA